MRVVTPTTFAQPPRAGEPGSAEGGDALGGRHEQQAQRDRRRGEHRDVGADVDRLPPLRRSPASKAVSVSCRESTAHTVPPTTIGALSAPASRGPSRPVGEVDHLYPAAAARDEDALPVPGRRPGRRRGRCRRPRDGGHLREVGLAGAGRRSCVLPTAKTVPSGSSTGLPVERSSSPPASVSLKAASGRRSGRELDDALRVPLRGRVPRRRIGVGVAGGHVDVAGRVEGGRAAGLPDRAALAVRGDLEGDLLRGVRGVGADHPAVVVPAVADVAAVGDVDPAVAERQRGALEQVHAGSGPEGSGGSTSADTRTAPVARSSPASRWCTRPPSVTSPTTQTVPVASSTTGVLVTPSGSMLPQPAAARHVGQRRARSTVDQSTSPVPRVEGDDPVGLGGRDHPARRRPAAGRGRHRRAPADQARETSCGEVPSTAPVRAWSAW